MKSTRRICQGASILFVIFIVAAAFIDSCKVAALEEGEPQTEEDKFLLACSGGQEDEVLQMLAEKPGELFPEFI